MKKEKTEDISVTEYASLRNISRPAVLSAIARGFFMSGVKHTKQVGRAWVLSVVKSEIIPHVKNK